VSRICHGGYPDNSTVGPNKTKRSGSPMTLSDISASIRSTLISLAEILERCDISVRVLVRSTRESRPSSADSNSTDRCGTADFDMVVVGVVGADSIEGTWGARNDNSGA
jgi:hypothetical protein